MNAVFLVPELFEHIFGFLDFKDLLLAQRVCQHFDIVINSSRRLRRALHLIPAVKTTVTSPATDYSVIRLLPKIFAESGDPVIIPSGTYTIPSTLETKSYPTQFEARVRLDSATGLFGKGRWRQMLVTQPPLKQIKMQLV